MKMKTITAILAVATLALFFLAWGITADIFAQDAGESVEHEADETAVHEEDEASVAHADIPKGYPVDIFPIYKPETSEIIGGAHNAWEGMDMYTLVIGTHDDVETVSKIINDYYKDNSEKYETMSSDLLLGEKGGWEYAIVINDGTADNYGTILTYTLKK